MKIMRSTAFLLTFFLLGIAGLSSAEDVRPTEVTSFDIPSQNLETALIRFSEQTDLQLVMASEEVSGKAVEGISGEWSNFAALDELLEGTGLGYQLVSDHTVAIGAADSGRGDSDSKNLSAEPVLMAKNMPNQTSSYEPAEEDEGGSENEGPEAKNGGERATRGQIETIVVVGSRNTGVRRYEDDVQPYVVLEATEIETSFANNLEDLLRTRLPQNTTQIPFSLDQGVGSQANGNQSSINLRGLGTDQTLILVNGRRLASRSAGGFDRRQPDINAIPLSAVERIEILPSTASGIYGGGATGGVINIVLKRQYTGADLVLGYDNTFESDVAERRIDASGGFGFEGGRTNTLWSFSYSDSNELLEADRGFSQRSRNLLFQNNPDAILSNSRLLSSTLNIVSADGDLVLDDGTPLGSPITFVPLGYAGPSSDGGAAFVDNAGQFNLELPRGALGQMNSLVNNPEILSGSLFIEREFTPWLDAFLDVTYFSNDGHINRGFIETFGFLEADVPTNPFDNDIRFSIPSPDPEVSVPTQSSTESVQAVGGVNFDLPGDWGIQIEYSWGQSETLVKGLSSSVTPDFAAAVRNGEIDVLRDLNEFPIDVEPFLFDEPTANSGPFENLLKTVSGRFSGPLISLPGGRVQFSGLFEQRNDEQSRSFSDRFFSGFRFVFVSPESKRRVRTAYGEVLVPIFSDKNRVAGVEALELQIAVRYDDYETQLPDIRSFIRLNSREEVVPPFEFMTTKLSSTNHTFGLRYSPISDLAIRASVATGFLPPSLGQLSVPSVSSRSFGLATVLDPKRGGEVGNNTLEYELTAGGNSSLEAEESESYSAGIILTPRFLPGFRASVDYTLIEKTDEIISPLIQDLLLFEDQLPARIMRAPLTLEDEARGFSDGEIIGVDVTFLNFASSTIEAFDFQVSYMRETEGWGVFDVYAVATLQTALETQILPTSPVADGVGFADGPLDWRGNVGITWDKGAWTLGWNAQYYDSYSVFNSSDTEVLIESRIADQGGSKIPSQVYHDVFAAVQFDELSFLRSDLLSGTELRVGIQNIFDEEPPIIASRFGNTYSTYGDPRLRRYSIQLRKSF